MLTSYRWEKNIIDEIEITANVVIFSKFQFNIHIRWVTVSRLCAKIDIINTTFCNLSIINIL